ncbi:imidazoleglycerol-phosphate dehydratase [Anopheles sinensis]|uniref:Imidazoleglycerol-phosphate dehydratase n=1 Tax=Anopheles sinensis TaxID=74873 RepID=A0A084WD19_ANOSI|nr:imidazoleglycerol-phosphate dehydratase [Anopheles sinensis]
MTPDPARDDTHTHTHAIHASHIRSEGCAAPIGDKTQKPSDHRTRCNRTGAIETPVKRVPPSIMSMLGRPQKRSKLGWKQLA